MADKIKGGVSVEGTVQFFVEVKISSTELATWEPERIAAFFAGLAQAIDAKAGHTTGE